MRKPRPTLIFVGRPSERRITQALGVLARMPAVEVTELATGAARTDYIALLPVSGEPPKSTGFVRVLHPERKADKAILELAEHAWARLAFMSVAVWECPVQLRFERSVRTLPSFARRVIWVRAAA